MSCVEHGLKSTTYASARHNGKTDKLHRKVYMQHHGVTLQEGEVILHSCDNPRCINIDHLSVGSYSDNNQQAWDKGRQVVNHKRGRKSPLAKLTAEDLEDIKQMQGTTRAIGMLYDISSNHVSRIKRGLQE